MARKKSKSVVTAETETQHIQSEKIMSFEAALINKYPKARIVVGSLADTGEFPEFGSKRTATILCRVCDAPRRLPTSDIFHSSTCVACGKEARKAKVKAKPKTKK